jgi:hypothetical protein
MYDSPSATIVDAEVCGGQVNGPMNGLRARLLVIDPSRPFNNYLTPHMTLCLPFNVQL